jgi:hypothetical protein
LLAPHDVFGYEDVLGIGGDGPHMVSVGTVGGDTDGGAECDE